jgi:hypothetical protein
MVGGSCEEVLTASATRRENSRDCDCSLMESLVVYLCNKLWLYHCLVAERTDTDTRNDIKETEYRSMCLAQCP